MQKFLREFGVGARARGYCLGSLVDRWRGGLKRSGGSETVVVVVVVTTVCWVAGAKERCPRVEYGGAELDVVMVWEVSVCGALGGIVSSALSVGDAGAVDKDASVMRDGRV